MPRPYFANHSVDAQVEWPRRETHFPFGPHEIVALPPTKEHDASLHIDLAVASLSPQEGMSVLNEVLSIAAWLDDNYAVLLDGWAGNPKPTPTPRRTGTFPSSILDSWCNAWGPINDSKARIAVAIYREAVNMYHFHSIPYSVLGFYKIVEVEFRQWRNSDFLQLQLEKVYSSGKIADYNFRYIGFDKPPSLEQLILFLREDGRHAVAHAIKKTVINPDDVLQVRRMSVAALILRDLAREYMKSEMGLSTERWAQMWKAEANEREGVT